MNTILMRDSINPEELSRLITEFPQFEILKIDSERPISSLGIDRLSPIEVYYGNSLSQDELHLLPHLHWIHTSTPHLDQLAIDAIKRQENILVTITKEENVEQVGEFALSVALAFSKNLCKWFNLEDEQQIDTARKGMWSVKATNFLQIGLGTIGTEIARRMTQEGYKVIGASHVASFHRYCQKTVLYENLERVIPQAEIVCLSLPRDRVYKPWFDKHYMSLMGKDTFLLIIGPPSAIHFEDLSALAEQGHLRGICVDARMDQPLPKTTNLLITHESASYPKTKEHAAFQTFVYNLRQFLHGNLTDMKNVIRL